MSKESLHNGHRERMRNRLLNHGADSFCDHEFLEYLLFHAFSRKNTNEIAHELINKFQNFNKLFSATAEEIAEVNGMGKSSAAFLKLISDVCAYSSTSPTTMLESEFSEYFLKYFEDTEPDVCLLLNIAGTNEIRSKVSFTKKGILRDENEQRRIVEILLKSDCNKISLGINHAQKDFLPDKSDIAVTRLFAEKYTCIGINLIDSIVCLRGRTVSLRDCGGFSF